MNKPRYYRYEGKGGERIVLKMADTGGWRDSYHRRVYYRLTLNGATVFEGTDFGTCLSDPPTGAASRDILMTFLTLRKGDTDEEYFKDYTPAQWDFSNSQGEWLSAQIKER